MGGAGLSLLHFVFHLERDDEKEDANMSCGALFGISDDISYTYIDFINVGICLF
jgi:hypothetical protein